jgi:hypothetical protein
VTEPSLPGPERYPDEIPTAPQRKRFWQRLSRRGKILIIADAAVLALLVVVGVVFVLVRNTGGSSSALYTPPPPPMPAHVSSSFTDWGPAVCPSLMFFSRMADTQLPSSINNQLCMHDNTSIAIGIYDNEPAVDRDIAHLGGHQHYAIGTDDSNQIWVFLVLQGDPSTLNPLRTYGFTLHR